MRPVEIHGCRRNHPPAPRLHVFKPRIVPAKSKAPEAIPRPYRPTGYIRPPILMALILTQQPRLSTQRPKVAETAA